MSERPDQQRGLIPFKPGQSGNPSGGSKKSKAKRSLRQAVADVLNRQLPDELQMKLAEGLPKGQNPIETIADLIAVKLVLMAVGGSHAISMDAIGQLRQLEGVTAERGSDPEAPELPESSTRTKEIAVALAEAGVFSDPEVTGIIEKFMRPKDSSPS